MIFFPDSLPTYLDFESMVYVNALLGAVVRQLCNSGATAVQQLCNSCATLVFVLVLQGT